MKVPCGACGKLVLRKRLVLVHGLFFRRGRRLQIGKVCQECYDTPEEEHRKEVEEMDGVART